MDESRLLCHNHTSNPRPPVCKYIKVKRSWLVINLHCHAYVVSIAIRPSHQYPSVNLDQYAGLFLLCICIPLQHKKRSMHWSSGNPVFLEIRVWVHLIDKINTVWLATNCKKIDQVLHACPDRLPVMIMAVKEAKPKLTLFRLQNWSVSMILGSGLAFYSTSAF